ncbi:ROK family transcriptional regulator [Agromyces sp. NPDC055520]
MSKADRHPLDSAASDSTRVGNLDSLRRSNLSTVLGLVHANRSLTRADITRATGLNRSTIATIVVELEELGLVTTGQSTEPKRVGRPSAVVTPAERVVAIVVNPELDATTIGVVALGGKVLRTVRFATERIPTSREVVNATAAVIAGMRPELESSHVVAGIGLAVPGLVRARDGLVKLAPHLGWVDEPLVEMIATATGLPAYAANDANCGIVADSLFGEGDSPDDIVYLNGGASGIGGGVISGGHVLTGASGYGGELGHTLVNSAGVRCHCGATGCLETEVTRAALIAAVGAHDSDSLEALLVTRYLTYPEVRSVVDAQLAYLSVALRNIVNAFNPARIILGGFLATLHAVGGAYLETAIRSSALPGPADDVEIVASSLGRDNLLIGAAELVFAGVLRDPAGFAGANGSGRSSASE